MDDDFKGIDNDTKYSVLGDVFYHLANLLGVGEEPAGYATSQRQLDGIEKVDHHEWNEDTYRRLKKMVKAFKSEKKKPPQVVEIQGLKRAMLVPVSSIDVIEWVQGRLMVITGTSSMEITEDEYERLKELLT